MKTTTLATTLLLLSATLMAFAPTASAHVCAFDYSDSCSKADCGPTGTHVHWGSRTVPCVGTDILSVGTAVAVGVFNAPGVALFSIGVAVLG